MFTDMLTTRSGQGKYGPRFFVRLVGCSVASPEGQLVEWDDVGSPPGPSVDYYQ
jgi:hypothetical protein